MVYFTIVFFCTAILFLTLLEDRFRIWTTLLVNAGVYGLSLIAAFILRRCGEGPFLTEQLPCAVGSLLFLLSSLFLYVNNFAQKLFAALLSLCSFGFLSFFTPLLLGAMPFSTAGAFAGVLSAVLYLFFTALLALCLYRPFHHYSDRGVSGFLIGMCLFLCVLYFLCIGSFDILFRGDPYGARLLIAVALYGALIFIFRSMYHAGRFREAAAKEAARGRMLEMQSGDFADMLAALREVRAAQKNGEYALDTITVMLRDGEAEHVPDYIASAKRSSAKNPILAHYHDNPYINAVIATKAAFALQNDIDFTCSAAIGETPLKTAEVCIILDEMLTRATRDAAAYDGDRKLSFTVIPGEETLRFEAVYSSQLAQCQRFSLKGKKWGDVLTWLFDDAPEPESDLHGLENTEEIIGRYSGKLSLSGTPGEVILAADIRF